MSSRERERAARIEEWLAAGGQVVASSARAARSIAAVFHAGRKAEGKLAWPTPAIFAWDEWLREAWLRRSSEGRMLLTPLQEEALWKRVIRNRPAVDGIVHLNKLARAAMRAHALLADYAPATLQTPARLGWSGDAEIFSQWLTDFDRLCRREAAVSAATIPSLLQTVLRGEAESEAAEAGVRVPLLLIGFDKLLPSQRAVLDAWGPWKVDESAQNQAASRVQHFETRDAAEELRACVRWLSQRQKEQPGGRWMVIAPALAARRGAIERSLRDAVPAGNSGDPGLDFEFSLGTPLALAGPARSALLLLRWMGDSADAAGQAKAADSNLTESRPSGFDSAESGLTESELDWLLGSGFSAVNEAEEIALTRAMVELRRAGRERPEWSIEDFCQPQLPGLVLPESWTARLLEAKRTIASAPPRQRPMEWVRVAEQALDAVGWPGFRAESSVAYQLRERWENVLEACAGLGFDGSRMSWPEFVGELNGAVAETIFAAESRHAAIQITEPLTAAGQIADGIWFLGADEESWPASGQPHPLLPTGLQRDAGMPHASHAADWELGQTATARLLDSADEVIFSFARHAGEVEMRPSRLVVREAGAAQPLPTELTSARLGEVSSVLEASSRFDLAEIYEDFSRIGFPPGQLAGGAETLTSQSLCPFQAFASKRLNVPDWEPAEAGLNARQRGQLLHAVLRHAWAGASRGGISTHAELMALANGSQLEAFVCRIVRETMRESFRPGRRSSLPARFPARLLMLESERLSALVTEWLGYECRRATFTVADTERKAEVTIAGLRLNLRLDRIDRLPDGSELVIDYKSSEVGPSAWKGDRPDDVQLPLYATFAMQEQVEGLLIAQVRPGEPKFCGRVRHADQSLLQKSSKRSALVSDPLTDGQMDAWRAAIEGLAEDFLAGSAEVAPKDPAKTCARCGLHTVCRIHENASLAQLEAAADEEAEESSEPSGGGRADA